MGKKEGKKGGKGTPEREVIRGLFKRQFEEPELVLVYSQAELCAAVNTIVQYNEVCVKHLEPCNLLTGVKYTCKRTRLLKNKKKRCAFAT